MRHYCDQGYLPKYCGAWLEGLAGTLPDPARVVEIGTATGCSLQALLVGLRQHDDYHVWTVDIRNLPYLEGTMQSFNAPRNRWTQITAPSLEIASTWKVPLDLVYIDGDHEYISCQDDIAAWEKHLKFGGIMVFDDYEQFWWPVTQAVDDIMFAPDSTWRFIGQVGRVIAFEKGTRHKPSPWLTEDMLKHDTGAVDPQTQQPDPWLCWAWGFIGPYSGGPDCSPPLVGIRRDSFEKADFIYRAKKG